MSKFSHTSIINMTNDNQKPIANQFILIGAYGGEECIAFQSYKSVCAVFIKQTNTLILGKHWDFSPTTTRYLKKFINEFTTFVYDNKRQFFSCVMTDNDIIVDKELV